MVRNLVVIICAIIAMSSYGRDITYNGYKYTVTDETSKTVETSYCGSDTDPDGNFEIPSIIKDENGETYTVTGIGAYSFKFCETLVSVIIPHSVTYIADEAFYRSKLKSLEIPSNVMRIGGKAFYMTLISELTIAESSEPLYFEGKQNFENLTSKNVIDRLFISREWKLDSGGFFIRMANIGEIIVANISRIQDLAFMGMRWGKTVIIDNSVREIGASAFKNCISLESVTLPEDLSIISAESFSGCTSLKKFDIPKGVTAIGDSAFKDCTSLESVTLPEDLSIISAESFSGCTSLKIFDIPEGVTAIGDFAFKGCGNLKTITFPDEVISWGKGVLEDCVSLESVRLPYGHTEIGNSMFYGCKKLKLVEVPATLKSIGEYAFYDCESIISMILPNSVERIGRYAFYNCKSLKFFRIPPKLTELSDCMLAGCKNITEIDIPGSVTSMGESVFSGTGLSSFEIPEWMTEIPAGLLRFTKLKSIDIPQGVTIIGDEAFAYCPLESLKLPPTVDSIGKQSFVGSKISELVFPPSVRTVGYEAFSECENLQEIVLPVSVKNVSKAFRYIYVERAGNKDHTRYESSCRLKNVYSLPVNPPEAGYMTFFSFDPEGSVFVPEEAKNNYYDSWKHDAFGELYWFVTPDDWDGGCPYEMWAARSLELKMGTFKPLVMAESVVLDCDRIEDPEEGDVYELKASVLPEDALQYVFFKSTDTRMATVTQDGVVTIKDPTVNPGDSGIGYCEVLVYSVYSEEPMAVGRIGDSSGVEQTVIGVEAPAAAEIDYSLPMEVYNLSGARVASSTEGLQPGVYIIRQGEATAKIAVK